MADMIGEVTRAVETATKELVSVRHWKDASFISLPLVYPGGTSVSVKISPCAGGFRVSDNGGAYREIEDVGAERSFARTAATIAINEDIERTGEVFFVEVPEEHLYRAICDVAAASWRVVDRVYSRLSDDDERVAEHLRERLVHIFGDEALVKDRKILGASTTEWEVSAVVKAPGKTAIFQAVSDHPNSIYRASTGFHDLAGLISPPILIAVVRDKSTLGPRLSLLSQVANVIQEDQPDEVFKRAAA